VENRARRHAGPALATLVAVLTIAGSFLPLFNRAEPFGSGTTETIRSVQGAWRYTYRFPGQEELSSSSAPVGIPLLLAGALLLLAAVLGFLRAGPTASRTTLVASVFQLGTVCTVAMLGVTVENDRSQAEVTLGTGMWLLIAGAVLAAVATAVSFRGLGSPDRPEWADPDAAYADIETPPSGVVITVLPPD
jgi:hypothetical protein